MRILSRFLAASFVALLFTATTAHAQLFRAYAASYGNDANPCTVVAPCRLLPAALAAVQDGGEIWLLDSANFNSGTVTINKNVSILAVPGQVGSIVAFNGGNAININPGLDVALKNVSITSNATSPGNDGIDMTTGKLSIQDSTIAVPIIGVNVAGNGWLSVHNTVMRDTTVGVQAKGGAMVDVSHSKFINMQYGVYVQGSLASVTTYGTVRDCEFTKNVTAVEADGFTVNATARLSVHDSSISGGSYGVVANSNSPGANSSATVGASTISGVGSAALTQNGNSSAVLQTLGNNLIVNNAANTLGTITPVGGV